MPPLSDQPRRSPLDDIRWIAGLLVIYGVVLASLMCRLPYWLDELLQILGTREGSFERILAWMPTNVGSAPLPYLLQAFVVQTLGYSVFTARLPAAMFSVLSLAALVWLARELDLRRPAVALVILMVLPLQWRYALEARPNSQAMFFAVLATVLAVRCVRDAGLAPALLYALTLIAGVFTYSTLVLLPAAHLIWAFLCLEGRPRRQALLRIGVAGLTAAALLAPWVFWARSQWAAAIADSQWHFLAHPRLALVIVRELSGGGYLQSIPLIATLGLGLFARSLDRTAKVLLIALASVFLAGTLIIDAYLDYFYANRQLLPIFPFLALLAAAGVQDLYRRHRTLGVALAVALLAVSVVADARWFLRPRENWQAASKALKATSADACLLIVPSGSMPLYAFFEPDLTSRDCAKQGFAALQRSIIVALSPYGPPAEVTTTLERLRNDGRTLLQETDAGGTRILFYGPPSFAIP